MKTRVTKPLLSGTHTHTHMFKQIHVYFRLYDLVHTHMFKKIHVFLDCMIWNNTHMFKQIHVYFRPYDLVHTHTHTSLNRFMYISDSLIRCT
jgi:hypothetical protein